MTSTGEITVELMQQILREVKKDNTIVVLPCLDVHKLKENLHAGSYVNRVTATYTGHGEKFQRTQSLIIKVMPRSLSSRGSNQESSLYLREIQMFDEILPRMSVILTRALPGRHVDFSARVYYTCKTSIYLIAVEDLSVKVFKAPKLGNGLDLKHSLLALRALARFHAASVMIKREDESLFAFSEKYFFQEEGISGVIKKLADNNISVVTQAIETFPEFGRSWADRVRHRHQTLFEDLQQVFKRDDSGFNMLNHGDFGIHNVMYRHSEASGEVEEVMLVDFQCCSYNSPVLDLIQFIFGSASDEVRANHIDTLLREYHAELTVTLESLGAPREQTITLMQLLDQFDQKMLYGFFYIVCVLPLLAIDSTAEDGDSVSRDDVDKKNPLITDYYLICLRIMLPIFSQKKIL